MANKTITDDIGTCCTNIENANSKEEIRRETERIRGCCDGMEPEQAQQIQACCTNIENTEDRNKIREEVEKIRGCCG